MRRYENSQCDREHPVFSHVDFFWCYITLRGDAHGIAESSGHFTFDTGDKAVKSILFRVTDRISMDAGRNYVGVHGYLRRNCDTVFLMGIVVGRGRRRW